MKQPTLPQESGITYKPGTWVNFDGYVSLVVNVWQGYYERYKWIYDVCS